MEKTIMIGGKSHFVASDDDYLDAMGNDFEPHMVQLFRALISSHDVVADIGANIGLTALLFSSLAKQVYAFEPSPSTFNILSANLKRACVTNVDAVNIGLGNKTESLTITFAKNNRSGGYISDKMHLDKGHITEEIEIDTIDHYFVEHKILPSFLKIDVEGFEQNVIKGGGNYLSINKPTVIMEMNHFCLNVLQRITIPDFLDFMRSIFPYLYAVDTDNSTIIDLHTPERAYFVMYAHVVNHRFPNLVGGFDAKIKSILDALSTKSTVVTTLVHQIEAEVQKVKTKIVKGQVYKTPAVLKPDGRLLAKHTPSAVLVNAIFEIPIQLINDSSEIWYGYGTNPVLLSYHWQNIDGETHTYDGLRTPLSCELLDSSGAINEVINVIAPNDAGRYRLVLTMVQEGICWFEDKGFQCAVCEVAVSAE